MRSNQAYNSNVKEEAQEAPIDHTITGFKHHPGYIAEGHAFSGVLVIINYNFIVSP